MTKTIHFLIKFDYGDAYPSAALRDRPGLQLSNQFFYKAKRICAFAWLLAMFYLYWQQEPALSLGLGLSDFISFLKAIRIFASSICLRSGTGLTGYITLRLSTSIMNLSVQHKPLLSLSRCAIYDPRFWIYDNTIMSSIFRGFTAYIFIKLEITNLSLASS